MESWANVKIISNETSKTGKIFCWQLSLNEIFTQSPIKINAENSGERKNAQQPLCLSSSNVSHQGRCPLHPRAVPASRERGRRRRTWHPGSGGGRGEGPKPAPASPAGPVGASARARPLSRVLVLQSLRCHYHLGLHRISPGRSWPLRAARPPAAPSCLHATPCLFASHHPCRWIGTVLTGNCVLFSMWKSL